MFKFFLGLASLRFLALFLDLLAEVQRNAREARKKLKTLRRPSRKTGKAFIALEVNG